MKSLAKEILNIVSIMTDQDERVAKRFQKRIKEGPLTRDENAQSHFCVYFLPSNPNTKKVFIAHHKKAGLWLSPGGHIDKGEHLLQSLNREISEELGMEDFFSELPQPFLLSLTFIENKSQSCKEHLDLWFLLRTDGKKFSVDFQEFHNAKWMTIDEAKKIVTDTANCLALERIE